MNDLRFKWDICAREIWLHTMRSTPQFEHHSTREWIATVDYWQFRYSRSAIQKHFQLGRIEKAKFDTKEGALVTIYALSGYFSIAVRFLVVGKMAETNNPKPYEASSSLGVFPVYYWQDPDCDRANFTFCKMLFGEPSVRWLTYPFASKGVNELVRWYCGRKQNENPTC